MYPPKAKSGLGNNKRRGTTMTKLLSPSPLERPALTVPPTTQPQALW